MNNLREVTKQENRKNASIQKNNTSGVTGILKSATDGKWVARIKTNNKNIHLGTFKNKQDAINTRKEAEKEHGFHENHGI